MILIKIMPSLDYMARKVTWKLGGTLPRDHSELIDYIIRNYQNLGIPPATQIWREKHIMKRGFDIEPDIVFFHKKGLVTLVEATLRIYLEKREGKIQQLSVYKLYVEESGNICHPLLAYLSKGKLIVETPYEFTLEKLAEARVS